VDAVEMLVKKGANVNARDKDGHTPLKRAIDYEQAATANLLRELGGVE
jgi:ankyrin repeat protein